MSCSTHAGVSEGVSGGALSAAYPNSHTPRGSEVDTCGGWGSCRSAEPPTHNQPEWRPATNSEGGSAVISGKGWKASFKLQHNNGDTYWTDKPVVYFDDEGEPWVAAGSGLRAAAEFTGYVGIEEQEGYPIGVVAAQDWNALYDQADGGEPLALPIEAWVVYSDGEVAALVCTGDGPELEWAGHGHLNKYDRLEPKGGWKAPEAPEVAQ